MPLEQRRWTRGSELEGKVWSDLAHDTVHVYVMTDHDTPFVVALMLVHNRYNILSNKGTGFHVQRAAIRVCRIR